jgi:hypothetical protein
MSQQTAPPPASTADGSFFESSRKHKKGKKRGLLGLISRSPAEPSVAPIAKTATQTAPSQMPRAQQPSKTVATAAHGLTHDRQGDAKPLHAGHGESEQRRSLPEHMSNRPAQNVPNKPALKELIDGLDAELHQNLVKELGQPARKKKHVNTMLAEKMHRAGWSYKQIAKHFKVSPCTVRRRLKEARTLK